MGERIDIDGVVTAITYPGAGSAPHLDAIVVVGNEKRLLLRFLGQRDIKCLTVGVNVKVKGVLSRTEDGLAVINPSITVLSDRGEE